MRLFVISALFSRGGAAPPSLSLELARARSIAGASVKVKCVEGRGLRALRGEAAKACVCRHCMA